MPVCVTGMHRSGTSMVMSLLHGLGVHVGRHEDLMPATISNPDGHWENVHFVDLADAALAALGGGWDCPPGPARSRRTDLPDLRSRALRLATEVGRLQPWGWKDPRASLLLPFWFEAFSDLRVVVCLRNPLDVARSLHRRGHSSYALGLSLWRTYYEQILAASRPDQRLVTHYETFFERPTEELTRLGAFVDLTPAPDAAAAVARRINREYRHSSSTMSDLRAVGVAPDIIGLYRQLSEEAAWQPPALEPAPGTGRSAVAPPASDPVPVHERAADLVRGLTALIQDDSRRLERIDRQIGSLQTAIEGLAQMVDAHLREREYQRGIGTIAHIVERVVPQQATVAVISRGDEDLLAFTGRRGVHFPGYADGRHATRHPRDSTDARALLEEAMRQGAEYLVIPYPSLWWLDRYPELAAHLRSDQRLVWEDEMCVVFAIAPAVAEAAPGVRPGSAALRVIR